MVNPLLMVQSGSLETIIAGCPTESILQDQDVDELMDHVQELDQKKDTAILIVWRT